MFRADDPANAKRVSGSYEKGDPLVNTTEYQIGDKVRVVQVPPYLYGGGPISQETAEFFERCLGKVFPVEDFDEHGQLELWATEKGNPRKRFGRNAHTIWIEPECVEPFGTRGQG